MVSPSSVIYKYPVSIIDEFEVEMPSECEILYVDSQGTVDAFMWALVDPESETVTRRFCLRGTGHPFQGNEGKYIDSFQMLGGQLVWHLFERKE